MPLWTLLYKSPGAAVRISQAEARMWTCWHNRPPVSLQAAVPTFNSWLLHSPGSPWCWHHLSLPTPQAWKWDDHLKAHQFLGRLSTFSHLGFPFIQFPIHIYLPICSTWHLSFFLFIYVCELLSHVQLFATPWTVAHQAPLFMGFSRQEYWSGLPFPSPLFIYSLLNNLHMNLLYVIKYYYML